MSSCFRIFRRPIVLLPSTAKKVTLAAIYLHNYLRKSGWRNVHYSIGILDTVCSASEEVIPGLWRQNSSTCQINDLHTFLGRSCIEAQTMREEFTEYFISERGKLHFQCDKWFAYSSQEKLHWGSDGERGICWIFHQWARQTALPVG